VTAAVPTRADWGSAPLTLRRKPHRASTVEPPQARHQILRLPTEAAAAQASGEDPQEVGASINSPSALLMHQQPLTAILQRVAASAAAAIPGPDRAGMTLLDDGRADAIVASAPFVVAVDQVQHWLGQGPYLSAVASTRTQVSACLGKEDRWPHFSPAPVTSAWRLPRASWNLRWRSPRLAPALR
jgi:hypothetical protein